MAYFPVLNTKKKAGGKLHAPKMPGTKGGTLSNPAIKLSTPTIKGGRGLRMGKI